jgi:hypothetical protein
MPILRRGAMHDLLTETCQSKGDVCALVAMHVLFATETCQSSGMYHVTEIMIIY